MVNGRRVLGAAGVAIGLVVAAAAQADTPRIIGGAPTPEGEWPWMTALVRPGADAYLGQYCGGALVHPRWVLTAAHCFAKPMLDRVEPPGRIDLVIGRSDLAGAAGVRLGSRRVVVHPDFMLSRMDGDLALVELERPVELPPVGLPAQRFDIHPPAPGATATALGWGDTDIGPLGDYPTRLYQVELPLVSNAVCGMTVSGFAVTDNMICAGLAQGGRDTCQGDSGGPLVARDREGLWRQVGITSFGEGCALPERYGVYTRVERYSGWISETICAPEERPAVPQLRLNVAGRRASAEFDPVPGAEGYRLYYAPYPAGHPVDHLELQGATSFETELPPGASYYASVMAYRGNCLSPLSAARTVTAAK